MPISPEALTMLAHEAEALLSRLNKVKPFSLHMPMVAAASIPQGAMTSIERFLAEGRNKLRRSILHFIAWIQSKDSRISASDAQRRFTALRMKFNNILSQVDIFADVLNQRSEHEYGVWLSGLDAVAADALTLPDKYHEAPSVICYLDRGAGAAIRRARTRLPGGEINPVAIIRVPRERMIGSGIASSLVHEVGHQGSVLLGLENSLRPVLRGMEAREKAGAPVWGFFARWIKEILSDFWSVAKVGVASTLGLIGVVSLPRAFVFRVSLDDPHPIPWIRVKLSCSMGQALYPHHQWQRLAETWELLYPLKGLDEEKKRLISLLESMIPDFVSLLVHHRPERLHGKNLLEVFSCRKRQPSGLRDLYMSWKTKPAVIYRTKPSLAFAVIGQAKADGHLSPGEETRMIDDLLRHWALSYRAPISHFCELGSVTAAGLQ